jgi:integrase
VARKLTARSVQTIRPVADRQEIADGLLPGLYLIVQPSGAKSWAVRYRHAGTTRKHTLGSYPAITLEAARDLARAALRAVAEGRDPAQEKRERVAPGTVAALVEEFITKHVKRHNKARTAEETERLLNLHVLPRWKRLKVDTISRRDVIDLLEDIVAAGTPSAANHTLAAIRKMFNWALERDLLAASPCAGVKAPAKQNERERVLSDDELRAIWLAADKLNGAFGALVKLLMLTGTRRNEAAAMRWVETDLEITAPFGQPSTWIVPGARTKNGRTHVLPLSQFSTTLLDSLSRIEGCDFVLTTSGKAPVSGFSKMKRELDALLPPDMSRWTLHDLRRTCATRMAELGVQPHIVEAVLNHISGHKAGVAGIYNRATYEPEKRAALETWARHVEGVVSGKSAKVVPMRKA